MISLFLDTSIKYITISISKDNKQLYFFHEKVFEDLSIKLLPMIDEALKTTSIEINDIDKIYIVNGPGSFTGIRIGLTFAKILAWSLNVEIVPISSLELIATTSTESDYIIPYIDARRGNCFISIYDKNLNVIENDQFVNFDNFIDKLDKNKSYEIVSYDDLECGKLFPNIDVMKIINKHNNDIGVNPHSLNPNYLKDTEAEEKLKEKNDKENR